MEWRAPTRLALQQAVADENESASTHSQRREEEAGRLHTHMGTKAHQSPGRSRDGKAIRDHQAMHGEGRMITMPIKAATTR